MDPEKERRDNIEAEHDLIRRQARGGDPVCAGLLRLQAMAGSHGTTAFMAGTAIDDSDENDDG